MSGIKEIIEDEMHGLPLAIQTADQPTRLLVAKMADALAHISEGEPGTRVSEAVMRTAILMSMALCKPGHEPAMLNRASQIMQMLALQQIQRATGTPAGAVMQ